MDLQNRNRLIQTQRKTYGCQGEGWGEGTVRELEINMYTLLLIYFKWITNKYIA